MVKVFSRRFSVFFAVIHSHYFHSLLEDQRARFKVLDGTSNGRDSTFERHRTFKTFVATILSPFQNDLQESLNANTRINIFDEQF